MPVDPDGFDATSAASAGANATLAAAENDRVATVLAAQRQAAETDRVRAAEAALQRGIGGRWRRQNGGTHDHKYILCVIFTTRRYAYYE